MKKFIYLLLFTTLSAEAQKLSYGVVLDSNFYNSANNNNSYNFSDNGIATFNIGGYIEYNFTQNFSLKTAIRKLPLCIPGTGKGWGDKHGSI